MLLRVAEETPKAKTSLWFRPLDAPTRTIKSARSVMTRFTSPAQYAMRTSVRTTRTITSATAAVLAETTPGKPVSDLAAWHAHAPSSQCFLRRSSIILTAIRSALRGVAPDGLQAASKSMSKHYSNLWRKPEREGIDFSDKDTRLAYVNAYVTAHAVMLAQVWHSPLHPVC
jgi:hypothetical protein